MTLLRRLLAVLLPMVALAAPAAAQDSKVHVTASVTPASVGPGGKAVVTVTFTMDEGWHIYPDSWAALGGPEGTGLLSTAELTQPLPAGLTARAAQWPKPTVKKVAVGKATELTAFYEGAAHVFLPIVIDAGAAPGDREIKVTWSSQACTDKGVCLMEEPGEATLKLSVAAENARELPTWPAGFDPKGFDAAAPAPAPAADPKAPAPAAKPLGDGRIDFGLFKVDPSGASGLALTLLVCALAGLVMNLMPCVLPVIPIKIRGFQQAAQHAGGGRGRAFMLGTMTGLGITAFWFVIALLITVAKVFDSVSDLFSYPSFQLITAAFIFVMALGLMGAFTIQLPQSVSSISVGHDTLKGSFLFGVMTAVLGTPCFGPFVGAALAWATQQPSKLIPIAAFTCVGIGMGVPYMFLAAFPSLTKALPKAGPASDLLKQVMGMLMIAVAAFFLGSGILVLLAEKPYLRTVIHWWAISALCVGTAGWLIFQGLKVSRTGVGKTICVVFALLVAAIPLALTLRLHSAERTLWEMSAKNGSAEDHGMWKPYAAESRTAALAARKVVVTDFTAEWCINCKLLEAAVLSTEEVRTALSGADVLALRADLTARTAPGKPRLKELNEVGIPVVSFEGPGTAEPIKLYFGCTVADVLDAIKKARGNAAATTGAWAPYSPEVRTAALAARKIVVTDFTADWAVSCTVLSQTLFSSDQVRNAVSGDHIVALSADVTNRDAPGWARLKELSEQAIPLTTIEGPGTTQPIKLFFGSTPEDVLTAIAQARGEPGSR